MMVNADFHVAYTQLFKDHFRPLCRYVLCYHKSAAESVFDAENIVQEVFIKVFEGKKDISRPDKARNLLYIMVRNACIDKLRARKSIFEPFDEDTYADDHQLPSDFDRRIVDAELIKNLELLSQNVDRLPDKCGKIIRAIYFDGMSFKEYALLDQITEQSARNLASYAIQLLREMMRNKNIRNLLLIWMLMGGPWRN